MIKFPEKKEIKDTDDNFWVRESLRLMAYNQAIDLCKQAVKEGVPSLDEWHNIFQEVLLTGEYEGTDMPITPKCISILVDSLIMQGIE